MKKYKYDGSKVIEYSTGFVIQILKSKEEAKILASRLNSGCGFAGETPRFFIYVKDQSIDIPKSN